MTAPPRKHPDVSALVPRFEAYVRTRGGVRALERCWRVPERMRLAAYLDCGGDPEGLALYQICCELSETQRVRLALLLWSAVQGEHESSGAQPR